MKQIAVVLFALFIMSCFPAGEALCQGSPKTGGRLIWGRGGDSVSLDPAVPTDSESYIVVANIYEGLVRYKDDSTDVEPALATSWETSADGLQWTFHLRKGVRFHDGTPLNAAAVVTSCMRQLDPAHPYYRNNFGYTSITYRNVARAEALDDHTVRIHLQRPYAPFLYNMAMYFVAPVISPAALEKWGDGVERRPVGTGPFKFVEWIADDRIILARNEDYWDKPPYLDELIFKTIINNQNRLLALETAGIDGMEGVDPDTVRKIEKSRDLRVVAKTGMNVGYMAMNTDKKPFDDVRVRRAVNHAINKTNLIKLLYQGLAVPAKNPFPPSIWGYNDAIEDYDYNPEQARALLADAGLENGFDTTLWSMTLPRPYLPQPEKTANAIKANLAAVGIRARIVSHEWKDYVRRVSDGEHDMALLGWTGDNGDPDNFLYILLDKDNAVRPKSSNRAFFRDETLHDLLIRAQQLTDKEERSSLYMRAQQVIHDQAPWVPLAHAFRLIAVRNNIHGVVQHQAGFTRFARTWIE